MLPEIATLWIGGRLSWLEQLCLKSFADAGHDTTVYSYAPIENVPEGVHAADAEQIFPSTPLLCHVRTGSPAIHADMWRLHLLKKTDKIWVDADMYCYRPFDFARKSVFGWEKDGLICNAVLGLPRTSKALNGLLDFFEDQYAIAPWLQIWQQAELEAARDAGEPVHMTEQDWGYTGPASVTWFLQKTGEIRFAEPQTAFYPISFKDRNKMILSRFDIEERLTPETRGIHFWARRMKPRLEEKEGNTPRRGSFMHKLLQKHDIDTDAAPIPRKKTPQPPASEVAAAKAAEVTYDNPADLLINRLGARRLTRIVDVGANPLTPPPYHDLLQKRGCEVWGFEPQTEAFEELQTTKSDLERYFPYAVGDGSKERLNIYRSSGLTSVFDPYEGAFTYLHRSRRNMDRIDEVALETRRLNDDDEIDDFDVLKIDIQGGEVKVFRGGDEKLRRTMVVIPEVRFYQLYQDEPMIGGIDTELRRQGFQLHKLMFQKAMVVPNSQIDRLKRERHRNQVIDADAVYIRDPGGWRDWSNEQLKHLAISAAAIFESHDLALFCLDKLVSRKSIPADMPEAYVNCLPEDLTKH
ncbi:MAG: FkbM family methyltransferase [Rhodobacter sp.]|nr:FkbM family methyltransferase [Rhodobacter sp.]